MLHGKFVARVATSVCGWNRNAGACVRSEYRYSRRPHGPSTDNHQTSRRTFCSRRLAWPPPNARFSLAAIARVRRYGRGHPALAYQSAARAGAEAPCGSVEGGFLCRAAACIAAPKERGKVPRRIGFVCWPSRYSTPARIVRRQFRRVESFSTGLWKSCVRASVPSPAEGERHGAASMQAGSGCRARHHPVGRHRVASRRSLRGDRTMLIRFSPKETR